MSQDHAGGFTAGSEQRAESDETVRPPHDDTQGLLRSVPRPLEPKVSKAEPQQHQIGRLEFEEEPLPVRHPSRQMMRWGPPPSDYGFDDRDDRRPWGRASYDYYGEDPYYHRSNRRTASVREPRQPVRGPPHPPRRPQRPSHWDGPSEDESEAESTPRKRKLEDRDGTPPPEEILRLPFTMWMNSSLKNHFVATVGEFVGTTMFLFFAFAGTQVANIGAGAHSGNSTTNGTTGFSPIVLLYIGIAFGFSLMVNVWIFFRISGGLFNPAVTLAMWMVKSINLTRATLLLAAQIAGAIFSSFIVSVLFPTSFNVRTTLSSSTSVVRGVFIEAILTAELVFAIFMLAKEKHKATFMAPIGIGLALFVAELVGVYYTGGSLNPARSFGPCVVTGHFDPEHWIYWVGPAAGAIVAVGFYRFIKVLEYEMANPGQDAPSDAAADAATTKKEDV